MFNIGNTQRNTRDNWEHDSEVAETDDKESFAEEFARQAARTSEWIATGKLSEVVRNQAELQKAIEKAPSQKTIYCSTDTLCEIGRLASGRMLPGKHLVFKKSSD